MESLDIALKGIKAVFTYNMLREGVPKSNGIWEKRIQVVVTSGVRDKVRRGIVPGITLIMRFHCISISCTSCFSDKFIYRPF